MTSQLILVLALNIGDIKIALNPDTAPKHIEQIRKLVEQNAYDGITFHRVIDGYVAQAGDVKYGRHTSFNASMVGTGGSDLPNIPAEFSNLPHKRGAVSMARSSDPNSANSQFFICLADTRFLDGQYTLFGQVIEGMDIVDKIKKGDAHSGSVDNPDYIQSAYFHEQ